MKGNKSISIVLAIFVILIATLACGGSVSTANIANAHMARDVNDADHTSVFAPSDPTFYCFFDLKNAPDDTKIKGVWTLVSAEGYTSNSEIDSAEITGGDNNYYFKLDRSSDTWPVGKYKIDLYMNDKLVQTLEFQVQ